MKFAAVLAAALALVAAGPALALPEPSNDAPLAVLGEGDDDVYFVLRDAAAQTGDVRDLWVFVAHKVPPRVSGDLVVGAWMLDRVDCNARTLQHVGAYALRQNLTEAFRDTQGREARVVGEGSLGEIVLKHACTLDVALGPLVAGVGAAVQQTQAAGAR